MKDSLDLRDLIADEVEYRRFDPSITDAAVHIIKNNDHLLELLDMIVDEAIGRAYLSTLSD